MSEVSKSPNDRASVLRTRHGMFGVQGSGDTSGFGGLVETLSSPTSAQRPYGSWFDEVVDILEELLTAAGIDPAEAIEKVLIDRGQLTLVIAAEHSRTVAKMLRDDQDLRFELCLGTSAVHYPEDTGAELHAHTALYSITHNRSLSIEVTCGDDHPHLPSLVPVYPGNDWHEREAWDLMGIVFDDHPGLTRTAMPDDWVGHPQRKDYPLGGIPVEYKGAVIPPPDTRRKYS